MTVALRQPSGRSEIAITGNAFDQPEELLSPSFFYDVIADYNLPFLSTNPLQFPANYKTVCDQLLPNKNSQECKETSTDIGSSVFIFKQTVYVDVSFHNVQFRYSFTIKRSCDVRIQLIGVFLAIILSPDGNLTIEVPRQELLEELQGLNKSIEHFEHSKHYHNTNADLLMCIYQESQLGKNVRYRLGDGKRSRVGFLHCGVFYDHMRAVSTYQAQKLPPTSPETPSMNSATIRLVNNLGNCFKYLGTFEEDLNYYNFVREMRWLCASTPTDTTQTSVEAIEIYDFNTRTYIVKEFENYVLQISSSTRYRRLLICVLITMLSVSDGCQCEIRVNNAVVGACVKSCTEFFSICTDCADMDILLVIEALARLHRRKCVITEEINCQLPDNSQYLGVFSDNFYREQLTARDEETAVMDNSITIDDVQNNACQFLSSVSHDPHQFTSSVTKEKLQRTILKQEYPFLKLSCGAEFTKSSPNLLEASTKALESWTMSNQKPNIFVTIDVDENGVYLQWPHGRWSKMLIKVENSTPTRRALIGMLVVAATYSLDSIIRYALAPSCSQLVQQALIQRKPIEILKYLFKYRFAIEIGQSISPGTLVVGEYVDVSEII